MRGQAVVVVGAAGGVGASTLAALLAVRWAADPRQVVLVDLDPAAGGLEVLLGLEAVDGARWPDLAGVRGPVGAAELTGVLPRWGRVEVLGCDRRAAPLDLAAVEAVCAGLADSGRTVVVDLPARGLGGGVLEAVGPLLAVGTSVVVTGQDLPGVAAAAVACATLQTPQALPAVPAGPRLVLRRRAGARVAPGQVAATLGLPLLGLLPTDRRVAGAVDRGLGPAIAGWSRLSRAVAGIARGLRDG